MQKRRILFLGETFRADAITWMNGLKEFGNFEIFTWELKTNSQGISRLKRLVELLKTFSTIKSIVKKYKPDMVIAERTTSYGFLAALSGVQPIAIAQQGRTDLWPENSPLYWFKKLLQHYAFKKANLIHAWGPIMAKHMYNCGVDKNKILILPKGINLDWFRFQNHNDTTKIKAVVTRSLKVEYKHEVILKAFSILKKQNIPFELIIIGDGELKKNLIELSKSLQLERDVFFVGRINNEKLAEFLQESNLYISMPTTEGVSASLFEAMACGCFPIVTDLPSNRSWIDHRLNGVLVPSKAIELLANEIKWVIQNPELVQKAILKNRSFIETEANYAVNMKKISNKYHELIDTKQQNIN